MRTRRLIVVTPEGERELLFIGRLTVGRAPECDISLADTKISRRHAEFDASGPTPRVTDLGSRNGILVNGRKVGAADRDDVARCEVGAADLAPGDVVTVGDAQIRLDERMTETADRAPAVPQADDRTAVISPIQPPSASAAVPAPTVSAVPAAPAASPVPAVAHLEAPVAPSVAPPSMASDDPDKTSVLSRQAIVPPPVAEPPAAVADAGPDHTTVLPPPPRAEAPHAAPPVTAPAAPVPPAAAPLPPAAPRATVATPAVSTAPPQRPAPVAAPAPVTQTASQPPAVAPAAPVGKAAVGTAVPGPRFSWGGVVTLAAVVLGGLAVLLGALPLISTSAAALDALSQRQARTLAGWLAAGVDANGTPIVKSAVIEAVQAQPGVERVLVIERTTGRAVAPSALGGRAFSELPGIGAGWRELASTQVGRFEGFVDAYAPAGDGGYVVWVRYERPSASDAGLAVVVALITTLVLALVSAMLVKRHTKATLQHFTRQVELAVSGASTKVMQGGLIPGLERLPGVVAYLLERRAADGMGYGPGHHGLQAGDDDAGAALAPVDLGPPWLEVTPALLVAAASGHGPDEGAAGWATAQGRHLLDVLDGPVRNAVVQGLGALGMQPGAETTVPLGDAPPIVLRREPSGHVRVTLAAR